MEIPIDSADDDVRALVQLLRAHVQNKSFLTYQINQLKIKNSYRQSNSDFRDFRDLANLSKILNKKLLDLKMIHSALKEAEFKTLSAEATQKLIEIIMSSESNMNGISHILRETEEAEKYLCLLREKNTQVKESLELKTYQYNTNNAILFKNSDKQKAVEDLESEVNDMKDKLDSLSRENEKLFEKKAKITSHQRKSVDRIKIFQHLSESAVRLRSKLLFKEELKRNIKNAEIELNNHDNQVKRERDRLQILEEEIEENVKFAAKYEVELSEMQMKIRKLENSLEDLYREREELIHKPELEKNYADSRNQGDNEESVTISLSSLLQGFNEMRKEKESLIEENNKLKQRITSLFSSKV